MNSILVEHVKQSLENANKQVGKLRSEWKLLELYGMNSDRNRILLNNLVELPKAVYLELGVYRGASLVSALYKNDDATVYAVDNFCYSAFEGHPVKKRVHPSDDIAWPNVKQGFFEILFKYYSRDRVKFIESDFLKVKLYEFTKPINIVHFDIMHSASVSEVVAVLNHYYPALADTFTIVVNSYSQSAIREGIKQWNEQKNHNVLLHEEKKSSGLADSDHWYAGLAVLVIEKVK